MGQGLNLFFQELDQYQASILLTEEYLLEAICFDFTVESPHAELVDLFSASDDDDSVQGYAWTFAHDSSVLFILFLTYGNLACIRYRTPMCLLYPPHIIATACYILAQFMVDGPNSLSLDARISFSAPSASLPTPPSHKAASPDASRLAIEYFALSELDLQDVAGQCVSILSDRVLILS